ncbi:hypothetical protein PSECIP111951_03396 [Pseudoalteromonas holothuriae]|uniref:Tandem-95 repeat protein n=1 Tax=Pseudoalteromonas holothuriae TaxID=2963714 RepID=A0A9W4R233_9GAMM|nr:MULTISPECIES: Ig-like domain-containing protein [unclassified Pseudoalteromonas]CAH9064602.1 hypothetical protein PSECIP111854_03492 [Pseudoalteromonas sp. CIP111854]CAH9065593.1 hypothetical protein PSECIP111951_03396 [Pseudoalteromonas sp. CIP111951]
MNYRITFLFPIVLLLSACGGSSNDEPSIVPNNNPAAFSVIAQLNSQTNEDTSGNIDISATQTPNQTEAITVKLVSAPTLGTITGNYPKLIYTPDQNKFGKDHFTYTLKQGDITSEAVVVNITIHAINDEPIITGQPVSNIDLNDEFSFTPQIIDVDLDTSNHRFSIYNKPLWSQFDESTGTLHGTPTLTEHVGTFSDIIITVIDADHEVKLPPFNIEVKGQAWSEVSQLPGFQGSHLATTMINQTLFSLTHNYTWSSAMICQSAPAQAPHLSQWNIDSNEWLTLQSPALSRFYFHTQAMGKKIYVFGGINSCPSDSKGVTTMEVYDVEDKSWQTFDSPEFTPFNNAISATCSTDSMIYAFVAHEQSHTLYTLDAETNTWHSKVLPDMKHKVSSCAIEGEQAYLIAENETAAQKELITFDLTTQTTSTSELIPQSVAFSYTDVTLSNHSLYVLSASHLMAFDLDTKQWKSHSSNPYAMQQQDQTVHYLRDFKLENSNGKLYSIGGAFTTQYEQSIYVFDISIDN